MNIYLQNTFSEETETTYTFSESEIQSDLNIQYYTNSTLNLFHSKFKNAEKIYIKGIKYMFRGCYKLTSIDGISEWNTNHIKNMNNIFDGCRLLLSLPDISRWNTSNVNNISYMFKDCENIKSLPDISRWKVNNVFDMEGLFYNCKSLLSLPNIGKMGYYKYFKYKLHVL